jgi:protein-S-isoprenylcysteine O-methyltransferase Ste14
MMTKLSIAAFAASMALFVALEIFVGSRQIPDVDSSKDGNSLKRIARLRSISFIMGVVFYFIPIFRLPGGRNFCFTAGAALIFAGSLVRFLAVLKLGGYFTSVVTIQENQKLITDGLYKYIRHPAYTGALLFCFGYGVATGSFLGLIIIMIFMSYGFYQRIRVEEQVMVASFGQGYLDYMKSTKRVIPFIY